MGCAGAVSPRVRLRKVADRQPQNSPKNRPTNGRSGGWCGLGGVRRQGETRRRGVTGQDLSQGNRWPSGRGCPKWAPMSAPAWRRLRRFERANAQVRPRAALVFFARRAVLGRFRPRPQAPRPDGALCRHDPLAGGLEDDAGRDQPERRLHDTSPDHGRLECARASGLACTVRSRSPTLARTGTPDRRGARSRPASCASLRLLGLALRTHHVTLAPPCKGCGRTIFAGVPFDADGR